MLLVLVLAVLAAVSASGSIYANNYASTTTQSSTTTSTELTSTRNLINQTGLSFKPIPNSIPNPPTMWGPQGPFTWPVFSNSDLAPNGLQMSGAPNYTASVVVTQNISTIYKNLGGTNQTLYLFISYFGTDACSTFSIQSVLTIEAKIGVFGKTHDDTPFKDTELFMRPPIPAQGGIRLNFAVTAPRSTASCPVVVQLYGFAALLGPTIALTIYHVTVFVEPIVFYAYQSYSPPLHYVAILSLAFIVVLLFVDAVRQRKKIPVRSYPHHSSAHTDSE